MPCLVTVIQQLRRLIISYKLDRASPRIYLKGTKNNKGLHEMKMFSGVDTETGKHKRYKDGQGLVKYSSRYGRIKGIFKTSDQEGKIYVRITEKVGVEEVKPKPEKKKKK